MYCSIERTGICQRGHLAVRLYRVECGSFMHLSIIVPAYNEERYLVDTVTSIRKAGNYFQDTRGSSSLEVIVVDNDSDDRTSELAAQQGCRVLKEKEHNIGKVRNTGAREASGDVLVFIDADTLVPLNIFELIAHKMEDPNCIGGAVDVCYKPAKRLIRYYLYAWRLIGILMSMAQGATQFCRKLDFHEMGGYDENLFMGEDVEFYWKMKRWAKKKSGCVVYIDEARVIPSTRRFDQWSIWKTFVMTNPIFIILFRKTKSFWSGWYVKRPD